MATWIVPTTWALVAVIFLAGLAGALDMWLFVARTRLLESERDLDAFRGVVARNMYLAVAMMVLAIAGALVLVASVGLGWVEVGELMPAVAAGIPLVVAGFLIKSIEKRVKTVRAADDELRAERDRVVRVWESKAFPDW